MPEYALHAVLSLQPPQISRFITCHDIVLHQRFTTLSFSLFRFTTPNVFASPDAELFHIRLFVRAEPIYFVCLPAAATPSASPDRTPRHGLLSLLFTPPRRLPPIARLTAISFEPLFLMPPFSPRMEFISRR